MEGPVARTDVTRLREEQKSKVSRAERFYAVKINLLDSEENGLGYHTKMALPGSSKHFV